MSTKKNINNPIDKDNITETPNTLSYGHHRGSFPIIPTKEGVIKNKALSAMEHQTDIQLKQIKDQMSLLAKQANQLKERVEISQMIYNEGGCLKVSCSYQGEQEDNYLIFKKGADQIYYFEANSWTKKDLAQNEQGQTVLSSYKGRVQYHGHLYRTNSMINKPQLMIKKKSSRNTDYNKRTAKGVKVN